MEKWLSEAERLVEAHRGFEVRVEGGEVKVVEARVEGKAKLAVKELRKYAGRRVLSKEMRRLLLKIVERLGSLRVPFKVVIGAGEFTVRFDLDHYVRVHKEGSAVVGFKDLSEPPLNSIAELLREHGGVRLLSPVR